MKYLPITLIATLSASLLMAIFFVPTVGALFGGGRAHAGGAAAADDAERPVDVLGEARQSLAEAQGFTAAYIGIARAALRRPLLVLMVALAFLGGSIGLYELFGRGYEFFPEIEPELAMLNVHARGDLSVDERDTLVRQVEQRILGMPEFESMYTRAGTQLGNDVAEDVIGVIQISFVDWEQRRSADEILTEIRERTADLAGIIVEPQTQDPGVTQGKPIQIELASNDMNKLRAGIERVRQAFADVGDLIDVTDNLPLPGIDWTLRVDREQAARFGTDISTVGSAVQLVTNGILIGDYRPDDADDEVDIRVRFPEEHRNLSQLDTLRIASSAGLVPISNFVTRSAAPRVGNIQRTDGHRVLTIGADVPEDVLVDDKVTELEQWLATANIDPSVDVRFRGEDEDQREAEQFLTRAFSVALFLMALILVTQFNSFYQAFLILTAVVFSTVGVLLGLLVTDQPFGVVMCGIGVIALAGIVVNNNIVLIDTYNLIRRQGIDALQAVLLTCAQRLRPVVLTTVTTILGLLPMVFGINVDFVGRNVEIGGPSTQWWTQLATAVAGGLAFATLLTLVMTPCLLLLGEHSSAAVRGFRGRRAGPAAASEHPGRAS
jgi:multidrug efflux pump